MTIPPDCPASVGPISRYNSPMTSVRTFFVLFLLTAVASPALAQGGDVSRAELEDGGTATVVEVVDGDTIVLDTGRQVLLVGIQAPKLPLGRHGFEKWPLADEAKAALEDLVLGRAVTLKYGGQKVGRHNRLLAHLFTLDGRWIQGTLLRNGHARVYSFADNRSLVAEMLSREAVSRQRQNGIWSHPYYVVLDLVTSADHLDR